MVLQRSIRLANGAIGRGFALGTASTVTNMGPDDQSEGLAGDRPVGVSILLVEDERSIAEPFANALTRSGYRTTVARSGGEAVALMRELEPDVVLLDLALPDADGRDICRQLR